MIANSRQGGHAARAILFAKSSNNLQYGLCANFFHIPKAFRSVHTRQPEQYIIFAIL